MSHSGYWNALLLFDSALSWFSPYFFGFCLFLFFHCRLIYSVTNELESVYDWSQPSSLLTLYILFLVYFCVYYFNLYSENSQVFPLLNTLLWVSDLYILILTWYLSRKLQTQYNKRLNPISSPSSTGQIWYSPSTSMSANGANIHFLVQARKLGTVLWHLFICLQYLIFIIKPYWFPFLNYSHLYYNRFFFFLRAAQMAYGSSQARGPIGAVTASLQHSHSNTRSKLHLWPTPQRMAMPDG